MKTRVFLTLSLTVLAVTALYFALDRGFVRFNYPSQQVFPIRGLDVSHHQGDIDWSLIDRKEFTFVYIKATEGGDHSDRKFMENWREALRAGFIVGGYHFYTFCRPVEDQIAHFLATVPALSGTLPPVLDLEFGGNCSKRPEEAALKADLTRFTEALEEKYGVKPVLYMTRAFYDRYRMAGFRNLPLWYRDIFFTPERAVNWTYWQFANRGRVAGIPTLVDMNVFQGSREEFFKAIQ